MLSFYFQCLYSTTNCEYKTILDFAGGPVVCMPMQGTRVGSLIQEDLTCHGATEPRHQSFSACALEPVLCDKRSHRNKKLAHGKQRGAPSSPQSEKAHVETRASEPKVK